jgi:hypothetical protein
MVSDMRIAKTTVLRRCAGLLAAAAVRFRIGPALRHGGRPGLDADAPEVRGARVPAQRV